MITRPIIYFAHRSLEFAGSVGGLGFLGWFEYKNAQEVAPDTGEPPGRRMYAAG